MALEQDQRIADVVGREQSRLRNFIRRRVPDPRDAEDILQEVFYELVASATVSPKTSSIRWFAHRTCASSPGHHRLPSPRAGRTSATSAPSSMPRGWSREACGVKAGGWVSVVAAHQSQGSVEQTLPVFQPVTHHALVPVANGAGNGNGAKTDNGNGTGAKSDTGRTEPLPPPQER